ncbi:hypothetical protein ACI77O_13160 [Pseudomonas tritici]|uniref:hypothetical protein n=1 Tax=Pseudomonas tritici TaxID=2745518 RepID=UPI00387ABD88
MQATDLFGKLVETNEISKPKTQANSAPRAAVKLDRREIWGEGGYLSTLKDDETSIHSRESFTENATIERLEKALFMTPVIKNGEWAVDGQFFAYKLTKPVTGQREFGKRGTILRDATCYMLQASAKRLLEESYKAPESWLPRWAYWLFCHRLRKAGDNEDPYALFKVFTAVMTQHDFLDESRMGETMRTARKRHRMKEHRAALRIAKTPPVAEADDDEFDSEFDAYDGDDRIIDCGEAEELDNVA